MQSTILRGIALIFFLASLLGFVTPALAHCGDDSHDHARDLNPSDLHCFAHANDVQKSAELIRAGANVSARDSDQDTPLHYAAWQNAAEAAAELIRAGANVTVRNDDQNTPLHLAAQQNAAEAAAELIRAGANVNVRNDDQTPLHLAAWQNAAEAAAELIRAGANVNVRDDDQNTPLHYAAWQNAAKAAAELIRAGANITVRNDDQNTPLHYAAWQNAAKAAAELIRAGANITVRNDDQDTPLASARRHKNHEVARVIELMPLTLEHERLTVAQADIRARCKGYELCYQKGIVEYWQLELPKSSDPAKSALILESAKIYLMELECADEPICLAKIKVENLQSGLRRWTGIGRLRAARRLQAARFVVTELECAGELVCLTEVRVKQLLYEMREDPASPNIVRISKALVDGGACGDDIFQSIDDSIDGNLPPEIQADLFLLRAQSNIDAGKYKEAREGLSNILFLSQKHGFDLPPDFTFRFAEVMEFDEEYHYAHRLVSHYLSSVGRQGANYLPALEMLERTTNPNISTNQILQTPDGIVEIFLLCEEK